MTPQFNGYDFSVVLKTIKSRQRAFDPRAPQLRSFLVLSQPSVAPQVVEKWFFGVVANFSLAFFQFS
jgi:hypothetical protein